MSDRNGRLLPALLKLVLRLLSPFLVAASPAPTARTPTAVYPLSPPSAAPPQGHLVRNPPYATVVGANNCACGRVVVQDTSWNSAVPFAWTSGGQFINTYSGLCQTIDTTTTPNQVVFSTCVGTDATQRWKLLAVPSSQTPRSYSNLVAWMDASDSTAVTYSTGVGTPVAGTTTIMSIKDKGYYGNILGGIYAAPSASAQPLYKNSYCPGALPSQHIAARPVWWSPSHADPKREDTGGG